MADNVINISLESKSDPTVNITTVDSGTVTGSALIAPEILFVATGGVGAVGATGADGTAVVGENGISQTNIADNSVGRDQLIDDAVDTAQLKSDSVNSSVIRSNAILSDHIATDSVTSDGIAPYAVNATHIDDGVITNSLLEDETIQGDKIADYAIVTAKIANNQVTTIKIADNTVTGAKIENNVNLDGTVVVNHLNLTGSSPALIEGPSADSVNFKTHSLINFQNTSGVTIASLDQSGNLTISGTVDGIDIATDVAANTSKLSYDAASSAKVDYISITQPVNLDSIESDVAINNAKISFPTGDVTIGGDLKSTGNAEIGDAACDASGGLYAVAVNNSTTASSKDAFACGELTVASGRQAFAGGFETIASGEASTTFGAGSTASGERAFAQGQETIASGENAVAINSYSDATGDHSFASGYTTCASGVASVAFGASTVSSGDRTFATGGSSVVSGDDSAAFGNGNTAASNQSLAIGQDNTTATTHSAGVNAFVGGYGSTATSDDSFVFGSVNIDSPAATGNNVNQFLIGNNLKTPQNAATASAGNCQFVIGKFNDYASMPHNLFTVGNGADEAGRSNAFVVGLGGNVGIGNSEPTVELDVTGEIKSSGDITVGGDLTITGNDIKDNNGTTCITFDSAGNTAIAGELTVTDLEITDDLTLGDDVNINATGRIYLAGAGNGEYIASLGANSLDIVATTIINLAQDTDVDGNLNADTVSADTVSADTVSAGTVSADTLSSKADASITIKSDQQINFTVDSDNDQTGQKFIFNNGGSGGVTEIASIDDSGNFQCDGDIQVSGNDIKDNNGVSCITFDSSGNTTVANTLNASVTGNVTGNASGSSGSCTGNSATATTAQGVLGATDADVSIKSDGNISFFIDLDGDETSQKFTFNNGTGNPNIEIASIDQSGNFQCDGVITAKQRHILNCGWNGNSTPLSWLPFGYGGTGEAFMNSSNAGYLEYGGIVAPCDGYIESVVIRCEYAAGSTEVGVHVAPAGTEVPADNDDSFISPAVNMAADDTGYKFSGFVDDSSNTNSFSAGDVIMISFNPTSACGDAVATAVLVLDWNNTL